MFGKSYSRSPQREDPYAYHPEKSGLSEIHTPFVLRSCRKSSGASPLSSARSGLPPNKSSMLSKFISGPTRAEIASVENSVLVYGFPMKMRNEVIEKFRKFGFIEEIINNEGNWITIVYDNCASANKALAYNFTFISEGVMIGVKIKGSLEVNRAQPNILSQTPQYLPKSQYLINTRKHRPLLSKIMEYVFNYPID
ncbi:hypothetical protein SteCoe_35115 [Stentor coeruleus]|uniref:RRM Nup35-type domain-containing protein n=1 Tax=Stentor coeruleus TaxID=5963 RepID=A0A1R2ATD1_9CILI|nr:hypothetical protein SteCoe_35115 [Stentor coeruleus]